MKTDTLDSSIEALLQKPEQAPVLIKAPEDTSTDFSINRSNARENFPDNEVACITSGLVGDNVESEPVSLIGCHQSGAPYLSTLPVQYSGCPKSVWVLFGAIKMNRSIQKRIRNKLIQIEARIEENRILKEQCKFFKDFQVACRRRTGVALSQKKDPHAQLISAQKLRTSNNLKMEAKVSAMYCGPAENSRAGNYRMALTKYPLSLERKKWSDAERENLGKGLEQEFHEMMLQISTDRSSCSDGSTLDDILASIKIHDITVEQIPEILPKVNWDQLACKYVTGRSGAECEARWLNWEDPLINHGPWTPQEDKNLLITVQEMGISNWFDIAVAFKANRTPFQCLARYQRSLNACILKREWSKEEDDQLRIAVETFGERDWQNVASTLQGRTGTQCSNRWLKSLNPAKLKVGRWASDEDKRLKVAAMLFGPKNWKKIAEFVSGRTEVQCRERWVNSLDPSLKWGSWTEEEDSELRAAILEHGYCWSKVAACVPPRTDSQCRRRWKVLLPNEVPLLQAAKKIQKTAFIGNFVDRESERPALGPKDFLPVATGSTAEPELVNSVGKRKKQSSSNSGPKRSKMGREAARICSEEVLGITNHSGVESLGGCDAILDNETRRKYEKDNLFEPGAKRMRKVNSDQKRAKCSEQDVHNPSLLSPPVCAEPGTISCPDADALQGTETTSMKKKKRVHKQPPRKNVSTVEPSDHLNPGSFSGTFVSSRTNEGSGISSTSPTITKGDEFKTIRTEVTAGAKRAPRLNSKRKMRK